MYSSILLTFLIAATPVAADANASPSPEPMKISIGPMSFTGDSVKLIKTDRETFECVVEGHAEWTLGHSGDADITICAGKMTISRDAKSKISIQCLGECQLTDSYSTCNADRMQIQVAEQIEMQMSGTVRVEYGNGENQTVLSGESITFKDGVFHVSGAASLKRGS